MKFVNTITFPLAGLNSICLHLYLKEKIALYIQDPKKLEYYKRGGQLWMQKPQIISSYVVTHLVYCIMF